MEGGIVCPRAFTGYTSVRFIRVNDWKLALVHWILVGGIISYVILYTIIMSKGYQTNDEPSGIVSTKVKGTASIGDFNNWRNTTVYDAMDIIYLPIEANALFITTSFVSTPLQRRSVCNGNEDIDECTTDADCEENNYNWKSQGILTGTCGSNNRCQVSGWCPLEDDSNRTVLNNVGSFTTLVRNHIRFPKFDIETNNCKDYEKTGKLTFGKNLFSIDDLVGQATNSTLNTSQLAMTGAILLMVIDWTCNLDYKIDECIPRFTVDRIDNEGDGVVKEGYNFRAVSYDPVSTVRELKKLYGIRIAFTISGTAGQFSIVALTTTFGAGIAYLGIATILTDLILTYFTSHSTEYRRAKYYGITKKIDKARPTVEMLPAKT